MLHLAPRYDEGVGVGMFIRLFVTIIALAQGSTRTHTLRHVHHDWLGTGEHLQDRNDMNLAIAMGPFQTCCRAAKQMQADKRCACLHMGNIAIK